MSGLMKSIVEFIILGLITPIVALVFLIPGIPVPELAVTVMTIAVIQLPIKYLIGKWKYE